MVDRKNKGTYEAFTEDFKSKEGLDKIYQDLGYKSKNDYMRKESEREEKSKSESKRLDMEV